MRERHLTAGQLAAILLVLAVAACSLFGHGDHDVLLHGQRGKHVVFIEVARPALPNTQMPRMIPDMIQLSGGSARPGMA
jgi:hypothetical protein